MEYEIWKKKLGWVSFLYNFFWACDSREIKKERKN